MNVPVLAAVTLLAFAASWALAFLPRRDVLFYSTDGGFYEGVALFIRRHHRLPRVNESYLLDVRANCRNEHPLLLAAALSLLPDSARLWLQRHGSGVLLGALASAVAAGPAADGRVGPALAAVALVLGTPILLRESVGFNPRILGVVLVSALWAEYAALRPRHVALALLAGIVLVALVALNHRFALQAACFTAVSLAVAEADLVPVLAFVGGLALALAVGGDHYRSILQSHVRVLRLHHGTRDLYVHTLPAYVGATPGAPRPEWWRAVRLVGSGGAALFVIPWLVAARPQAVAWDVAVGLWLAAMVITLVPPLRFLGEGERYLQFAAVAAAVSLGSGSVPATGLILLALGLGVSVIQYRKLWRTACDIRTPAMRPSLQAALQRVRDEPEGRILALPMWMADFMVCAAGKRVFDARSHGTWRVLPRYAPVLVAPVTEVVDDLGLEAAFVDTRVPVPQLAEIEALAELRWEQGPYRYYRFR